MCFYWFQCELPTLWHKKLLVYSDRCKRAYIMCNLLVTCCNLLPQQPSPVPKASVNWTLLMISWVDLLSFVISPTGRGGRGLRRRTDIHFTNGRRSLENIIKRVSCFRGSPASSSTHMRVVKNALVIKKPPPLEINLVLRWHTNLAIRPKLCYLSLAWGEPLLHKGYGRWLSHFKICAGEICGGEKDFC